MDGGDTEVGQIESCGPKAAREYFTQSAAIVLRFMKTLTVSGGQRERI